VTRRNSPPASKRLADYIHSKGLKVGSTPTWEPKPPVRRQRSRNIRMRGNTPLGVDYLKEDWCNTLPGQNASPPTPLCATPRRHPAAPSSSASASGDPTSRGCGPDPSESVARHRRQSRTAGTAKGVGRQRRSCGSSDLMAGIESYAGPGHWERSRQWLEVATEA